MTTKLACNWADKTTVEAARDGDPVAVARVTRAMREALLPMATRYAKMNHCEREDLLMEANAVLFHWLPKINTQGYNLENPFALIHKLCRGQIMNVAAKEGRNYEMTLPFDTATPGDSNHETRIFATAEAGYDRAESQLSVLAQVEALLPRLTSEERRVLVLRLQGLTTKDIALKLDCTDRSVRNYRTRIETKAKEIGISPCLN